MAEDADLLASLDKAAKHLLEKAGVGASLSADATTTVTLAEQVKAFDSVVEWAKVRKTLAPPEKTESAFDAIRNKFNDPPKRRGSPRRTPSAEAGGAVNGSDDGAADATADFFDA